jgi:Sec-independent protein translocase protein TatA
MFGIGPQEVVVIVLLLLVVFGPGKAASMARDFGRFVSGAQDTVEEFKSELLSEEVKEARPLGYRTRPS